MNNPFLALNPLFEEYAKMNEAYQSLPLNGSQAGKNLRFGDVIKGMMSDDASDAVEKSVLVKNQDKPGLFGSLSGKISGEQLKKIGGAIPGILGVGDALFRNADFNPDVKSPEIATDINGQPIYNQESFIDSNTDFRRDIKGTVGRGIGEGALSGFSAGLSSGNPLIAIGSGIVGGIGGLIGGRKRRKQLLREANRREDEALRGVELFNDRSLSYRQDEEADDFRSALISRRNRY